MIAAVDDAFRNADADRRLASTTHSPPLAPHGRVHSPATPVPHDGSGLPLSMQLVGPAFGETLVLEVAAAYERCTEWRPSAHSASSSHSMMCCVRRICLPEPGSPSLRREPFPCSTAPSFMLEESSRPPDGLTIRQADTCQSGPDPTIARAFGHMESKCNGRSQSHLPIAP